mgnify:CR=1 FL=1
MKIYYDISDFKKVPNSIVTIGTFDGVHRGHQEILKKMVDKADKINGETVVVTFYPHPRQVLSKGTHDIRFISTQKEKIELLEKSGIDNLIIIKFTEDFSKISSEDFIKNYIVKNIEPAELVIGYDHHFGNNRQGDFEQLYKLGNQYHFKIEKIQEKDIDNVAVSSTKIRDFLAKGDIYHANMLLGYQFSYTGKVVHGKGFGHKMGYPTANIEVGEEFKIIERAGVYATYVEFDGILYPSMTYIGSRPTLEDNRPQSIETHLFNFNEELYGKVIRILFVKFVRDDKKFSDIDTLKHQIDVDKLNIMNILNKKS